MFKDCLEIQFLISWNNKEWAAAFVKEFLCQMPERWTNIDLVKFVPLITRHPVIDSK